MSDYKAPPIPKTALANSDIRLYTKNSEDKWASMVFNVVTTGRKSNDNILEITVWTNETTDTEKNIKAQLDVVTLGIFLQNLQACIDAPANGEEYHAPIIEFEETRWVGNNGQRKPDGTFVKTKLYLGKDKENRVYIALIAGKSGRPNLKFIFHKPKLRVLRNRDGSVLSEAQFSVLSAVSYKTIFEKMAYAALVNGFVKPTTDNSGVGGQSRQHQSSSNNNAAVMDDDIPF